MAKGDLAPENVHNEGVEHGMKTGIVMHMHASSWVTNMHMHVDDL